MKIEKTCCDRCGREVKLRRLFNTKGVCFETAVTQQVEVPHLIRFGLIHRNRKYDLCYDCCVEIEKFINKDYTVNNPEVNYRPENDTVLYICNREACGDECREECKYTSNIAYAANFLQINDAYMEIDPDPDEDESVPDFYDIQSGEMVDTSAAEVNPDEEI